MRVIKQLEPTGSSPLWLGNKAGMTPDFGDCGARGLCTNSARCELKGIAHQGAAGSAAEVPMPGAGGARTERAGRPGRRDQGEARRRGT